MTTCVVFTLLTTRLFYKNFRDMNYAVIRGADTGWGSAFAAGLAGQKRHLILLGKEGDKLENLAENLRIQSAAKIHCLVVSEDNVSEIISTCNYINDHFEVDLLVNYTEAVSDAMDLHVNQFVKELTVAQVAGPVFTHQLLPNLLLHADAAIIELRTTFSDFAIIPGHPSPYQGIGAVSTVRTIFKELIDPELAILSGTNLLKAASNILREVLIYETESVGE